LMYSPFSFFSSLLSPGAPFLHLFRDPRGGPPPGRSGFSTSSTSFSFFLLPSLSPFSPSQAKKWPRSSWNLDGIFLLFFFPPPGSFFSSLPLRQLAQTLEPMYDLFLFSPFFLLLPSPFLSPSFLTCFFFHPHERDPNLFSFLPLFKIFPLLLPDFQHLMRHRLAADQ